jgi:outer membrane protein assembly factor BamB
VAQRGGAERQGQMPQDSLDQVLPADDGDGLQVFAAGKTVYALWTDGSVLWRVKAKRKVYSSPAAAPDGTVFIGAQDDRLYAIGRDGKSNANETARLSEEVAQDAECGAEAILKTIGEIYRIKGSSSVRPRRWPTCGNASPNTSER